MLFPWEKIPEIKVHFLFIIFLELYFFLKESQAREQYEHIRSFVQGTVADGAPIIPISAQLKYNVDVCISLHNFFPIVV